MTPSSIRAALTAGLLLALATSATAQVTTEQGGSVLIYPKVIADASADSLLQIANLSPSRAFATCAYVDGTAWEASRFALMLEPMQPLHWAAARGRAASGADTNAIPPAADGFRGELLCVQTDASGSPFSGNQLVGAATLAALDGGDVAGYAAIGLTGLGLNDGDDTLCIGGDFSDACLLGAEYDPCPAEWIVNHPAEGAPDEQRGAPAVLATRLSVVPCSQNVRDGEPSFVDLQLVAVNEFEQRFAAAATVACWADLSLGEIGGGLFDRETLGGDVVQTRIRSAAPLAARTTRATQGNAFVLVAEIERRAAAGGPVLGRSLLTPHRRGQADGSDLIVLPMARP